MKEVRTALETMGDLMEKAYQEDARKLMNHEDELYLAVEAMKRREHEARCFLATIVAMLAVVIGVIVATLV
jgi:hypothetical protein